MTRFSRAMKAIACIYLVVSALASSSGALADSYTDTIAHFKRAGARAPARPVRAPARAQPTGTR